MKGDVDSDVANEVQAVLFAVLRGVGEAMLDGLVNGSHLDPLPIFVHGAADVGAVGMAKQAHGQLGASGTHESGHTHNLPGFDGEGDIVNNFSGGVHWVVCAPILNGRTSSPMAGSRGGNKLFKSRPTMALMIRASVASGPAMSMVSMVLPPRMMVTVLAMRLISLSLWEMMMQVMP